MSNSPKIKKGVLIVEDDADSSFIIEHTLNKINIHALETVVTGEDAIQKAEELSPDLILMDIMLQGEMDGIEAARIINNRFDIPIIFLTAFTGDELVERVASSANYGYLLKPIDARQLSVSIEVTMRQHDLEQQLSASNAWFQETVMGIGDGVLTIDSDGFIDFANPTFLRLTGKSREEIIGKYLHDVMNIVNSSGYEITQMLTSTATASPTYQRRECYLKSESRPSIPVDVTIIPVINKKKMIGWVIFLHDISERKQYEHDLIQTRDDLRSYKEELQLLSNNLRSIQEDERGQISREIHDEIAQNLARVRMDIQGVRSRLGNDDDSLEILSKTSNLVDECITSVRRMATELRPRILDDVGLIAAVEWQVEQTQERHNISIELQTESVEFNLAQEQAVDIFRIVQEGIQNVVKHAGATYIQINLEKQDGLVTLFIRDDGNGFDTENLTSTQSLGIVGMRERVRRWDGDFNISSNQGKGTEVNVKIPVV